MLAPRGVSRAPREPVAEGLPIDGMHRRRHLRDHFPRSDPGLAAGPQVERKAFEPGLDEGRPIPARQEPGAAGQPERQIERGETDQQPCLPVDPCVERPLGFRERQENHIRSAHPRRVRIEIDPRGPGPARDPLAQRAHPADLDRGGHPGPMLEERPQQRPGPRPAGTGRHIRRLVDREVLGPGEAIGNPTFRESHRPDQLTAPLDPPLPAEPGLRLFPVFPFSMFPAHQEKILAGARRLRPGDRGGRALLPLRFAVQA